MQPFHLPGLCHHFLIIVKWTWRTQFWLFVGLMLKCWQCLEPIFSHLCLSPKCFNHMLLFFFFGGGENRGETESVLMSRNKLKDVTLYTRTQNTHTDTHRHIQNHSLNASRCKSNKANWDRLIYFEVIWSEITFPYIYPDWFYNAKMTNTSE